MTTQTLTATDLMSEEITDAQFNAMLRIVETTPTTTHVLRVLARVVREQLEDESAAQLVEQCAARMAEYEPATM